MKPMFEHKQDFVLRLLRSLAAALGVVCVLCLVVFLVVYNVEKGESDASTGSEDVAVDARPDDGAEVILPATEDAGMEYQNRLIFVGDSLTARMVDRGVLAYGQATEQVWRTLTNGGMLSLNAAITEATVVVPPEGRQLTIAAAAAAKKPSILIVTLGSDWGVAHLGEDDFKAYYTALVQAILRASPSTTVILQSIFPVTADCSTLSNEQIDRANRWVMAVAAATECAYLDTQSVLKDETGCLKPEFAYGTGGVQLNADAYRTVLTYIRTHAYQE